MKKLGMFLAAGLLLASAAATAQTPMRIRGTITHVDGDVLSVKTRDGKDVKVIWRRTSPCPPPRR